MSGLLMDKVVKPKVAKQQFRSIEFFYPSPAPRRGAGLRPERIQKYRLSIEAAIA
jgi:hypothetical protein